jgi:hypothetical protein
MAVTITADSSRPDIIRVTLDAGDTTDPILTSRETVVTGIPGAGGTIRAQATWSRVSRVLDGQAEWFDWDFGAATARQAQMLFNATAVRFIAATAAAVGEVSR